ncbi:efflux RND transporter permease subunit [Hahella aquimaris]|uniref:efflux RND transporter permease subunit n=1 Tax=Hahella sp. HNIBRBA332 TaxID=3015983 RepID=UPI00273CA185|nr:efflux RND transporter permease subunit [Hahella sp. HNIBRBA332]WLQ11796.1 efflux RND transporter permease subunit [Hahella sp. HNIBRBA332]
MIAWFARNHVAANLLMLTILALGLGSLSQRLPLEVFPSVEPSTISISVSLRGATPEEVEEGVSVKIEEAVQDLEGVEQIVSRSSEGSASVTVEVDSDYDPRELLADVKSRVDSINSFPGDVEKPVISLAQHTREVITVAIAGPYPESEIRTLAEHVRDDMLRLDGVTQVALDGVRNYEISIEVPKATLQRYGITLQTIAQAISKSSLDVSAGNIQTDGGEVLIRSKGQAYRRDDFEDIVVLTQRDGSFVRVRDLATVVDGFEEGRVLTRFNGQPAAFVDVFRVGDQSAIGVADKVKEYIERKQSSLPVGVELTYWRDFSKLVKKRLQTLTDNAIQGGILVLLLLTLFLRPSVAFWVFCGIPISFMGAFLVMPYFGVTLNIFTLFAFILVLGIVVDDAIVTGESVYTHLRRAENGLQAAIQGTQEVAAPVTFGVLTTMAAFMPIAFIEGVRGQLFAQIVVVVLPIFVFSLIESKLILPAHLKHVRINPDPNAGSRLERWQRAFADGFENAILRYYHPVLHWTLRNRYLFLSFAVGSFILLSTLVASGWINFVFFPRVQSEIARASLTMPQGTPFEVTDRYVSKMADAAFKLKEKYRDPQTGEDLILDVLATSGGSSGSHVGRVIFEIVAPEERETAVTSNELVNEWRRLIGVVPGAESLTFRAEIGRVSDPIDIQFSGNNFETLEAVGEQVKARLASYPTVFDITDSLSDGKEELQVELKPEAYALGLNRADVINQIRQAFYGYQVQRIQRGRDDVRVMVRYPRSDRQSVSDLQSLRIAASDGRLIPLGEIAELKPGLSPTTIYRIDRYRTMNVRADIDKQNTNMLALQEDMTRFLDDLMLQHPDIQYSWEGEAKEQRESFGSLKWGLLFVLFMIYSLLAIPFKSYVQPLIVMTVIPFGGIGAVLGHWIMGMDLSLTSLLGMLALIGVVVNDSLVLVDFINKHRNDRENGGNLMTAVLNAGVARFRPVMLTSLTTFIGLMPLLFEKSTQAQFLIPMAVSLGFGILFATVLTLLLVPVNYVVIEDLKRLFHPKQALREDAA